MRLRHRTWWQKLRDKLRQEINFLPKRLVLITCLLLALYIVLAIRTELRLYPGDNRLIEASLKSKLTADYLSIANQPLAFAPLSFALVEAKIRDKNPYLSEAEVTTLMQTAIAAAHAPIITATPTPGLIGNAVIQSVSLVPQSAVTPTVRALAVVTRAMGQVTDVAAIPSPIAPTLFLTPFPATVVSLQSQAGTGNLADHSEQNTPYVSTPTSTMLPKATSLQPEIGATMTHTPIALSGIGENSLPPTPGTPIATVVTVIPQGIATEKIPAPEMTMSTPPPTVPTATILPPTQTTLSQPTATATPTIGASIGLSASLASTATAWPSATASSTPSPTRVTPTATDTLFPTPSPTVMPTATPTVGAPPAIINLTARVEADNVYLTWSPSSAAGVVGYNLYYSPIEPVGAGQLINSQPITSASYVDTVVMDGRRTFYVVKAVNQFNQESPPSAAVMAKLPDRIPPQTLTNFSLSLTGNTVQLQWQASSAPDLAGYNVYRSTYLPVDLTQGPLNSAALLSASAYQDTITWNGATYYYVFTTVDLSGNESLPSIEAQIPTVDLTAPAPPAGLTVTVLDHAALIQWQANAESDIAGYRLYRSHTLPIELSTSLHAELLLTDLAYRDDNLQRGETYYYLLIAIDINQNQSSPSEPVALSASE